MDQPPGPTALLLGSPGSRNTCHKGPQAPAADPDCCGASATAIQHREYECLEEEHGKTNTGNRQKYFQTHVFFMYRLAQGASLWELRQNSGPKNEGTFFSFWASSLHMSHTPCSDCSTEAHGSAKEVTFPSQAHYKPRGGRAGQTKIPKQSVSWTLSQHTQTVSF